MCPVLRRLLADPEFVRAARDAATGPTFRPWASPGDVCVEATAPAAEARREWCRLWALGVWVVSVTPCPGDLLRVVYAVPAGVRLA